MPRVRRRRNRIHDFHALEDRTLLTTLIALVDSGVDLTDQAVLPYLDLNSGYDAYNKVAYTTGGPQTIQDTSLQHGHGSVVAGMIVQGIKDATAAAGSTPVDVKIMPIRDTSSGLNIDKDALIRGVFYAADHGASVINLSVNTYYNPSLDDPSSPYNGESLVQAIQYAETKGAVVVTAPGNGASNIDFIPVFPPYADDPAYSTYRPTPTNVLVAAAVDAQGNLTSISNWGPIHVDLGAYSGPEGATSYSAGYTSGVAGVVSNLMPAGRTARNVIDVLDQTVTPHAQSVGAWSSTGGVLNPAAAVARVLQPLQTAAGPVAIDAGGGASGSYRSDAYFSGGTTYTTASAVDVGGVDSPAPQQVYQSARQGDFSYTIGGLVAGGAYDVRLDFAELSVSGAGQRLFNVSINGATALNNFDVFAQAGGMNKAVVRDFIIRADASGTIQISFASVQGGAEVNGIVVSTATDLALKSPVFSSTIENTAFNPQAAVDGNSTTRWSSGQWMQNTSTGWITVDLGDLYNIADVYMNWERAYAVNYEIQVSPDLVSWTTLRSVTGRSAPGIDDESGLSGVGRYVRIYCTQTNATDNYSLYDLNVYGTRLSNLAAGKPATSSTVESAAYLPANAVDSSSTTRWSSGQWMQNTSTGWFAVDLGALYNLSGVQLNWETAYAVDYQIQASTNGTDWTTLKTITGNAQKGIVTFDDLSGVGRFVRIYCTQTNATGNYSLYDVKVYGTPLTDLAAGKSATSSTLEGPGFEASRAVDSNSTTRWSSGQWMQNTQTGWIAVDLGAQYNIDDVRLNWEKAYAVDYQIQLSDDGVNWTTIRAVTGRSAPGLDDQSGLSGSGRYIRIYCTQTNATGNYSLYDLQVFGAPASSVTPQAAPSTSLAASPITAQGPIAAGKLSTIKRSPANGWLLQGRPHPSTPQLARPGRPFPGIPSRKAGL
ncbi:MAG: discoidin domain-containing protein [Paludisphaera borealis]|uniref:discoidin domain-containing protein n=1 Tax=Paludisphaera borealis TaxID=1387353 RepID=UPI002844427C|nr:discoidin domain-containing protein [Paludisphaera borealis]MDR3619931.1 discoidin domain-containing protein [Paludisphaera borealis]